MLYYKPSPYRSRYLPIRPQRFDWVRFMLGALFIFGIALAIFLMVAATT